MSLLDDLLSYRPLVLGSALLAFCVNYILSRIQEFSTHRRRSTSSEPIEPPVVPCWIPYLGSAMEMGQDILAFIRKYSNQYSSPIFSATIAGNVCHFVADSTLASLPFKQSTALSADAVSKTFMTRAAGIDADLIDSLLADKTSQKVVMGHIHQHVRKRKATETNLALSQSILKKCIVSMQGKNPSGSFKLPLYQLCLETIFAASVGPVCSETLGVPLENAHAFHDWLTVTPFLYAGMPSFLMRQGVRGRSYLIQRMKEPAFLDNMRPLLRKRREVYEDLDVFASTTMAVLFAVAGNSIPAVFWTLCNILKDPEALAALQAEIQSLPEESEDLSIEQLEGMTALQSMWTETLRMYFAMFAARDVVKDFVVETPDQDYVFRKGTRLMGYVAFRHHDEKIFPNPDKFVWDRFYARNGQPAPEFRLPDGTVLTEPVSCFGGGLHKCPGRFFIENEAKSLLVSLFRTFDIRLAGEIPQVEPSTQGLGMSHPQNDVLVEMRVRKTM